MVTPMLKPLRTLPIQAADDIEESELAYLEAWQYCDTSGTTTSSLTVKPLQQSHVGDWAWQRGTFAPGSLHRAQDRKIQGGLRILFVQSKSEYQETIPSVLLAENVLEALDLPDCTYVSYQQPSGMFSCHTFPAGSPVDNCARLSIVIRAPRKWECSIGGAAFTHDFGTGITTALCIGFAMRDGLLSKQGNHEQVTSVLDELRDQVKDCEAFWSHPFVLPCLFLATHAQRVRRYVMGNLSHQVVLVERSIGVTQAGRSADRYYMARDHAAASDTDELFLDGQLQRERAKDLTQLINDLSTQIIFVKRSPQWDIDCAKFLARLLEHSTRLSDYRNITTGPFRETLDYVQNYSEACLEVTQTSEARMALQLNILYTSVAQDDGQTSARIAASAGKDSTSMKIIALITAAYLPATFVATLFSMGMFQWTGSNPGADSGEASARSVSPDFWIYWAVSMPLTIITLAGWATWWKFEERRFDRDVQRAMKSKLSVPGSRGRDWEKNGLDNFLGVSFRRR